MILSTVLEEVSKSCELIKYFGIGNKYYFNAINQAKERDKDSMFPMCWVFLITSRDSITKFGATNERVYTAAVIIGQQEKLDSSPERITAALNETALIVEQFTKQLTMHPAFLSFTSDINASPVIFDFDENLVGWVVGYAFKLKEASTIECSTITTKLEKTNGGYH